MDAGVGEVWLYGSVARGESEPGSDIDLVAVLNDLEYRRRFHVKAEMQEVARAACGRRVCPSLRYQGRGEAIRQARAAQGCIAPAVLLGDLDGVL